MSAAREELSAAIVAVRLTDVAYTVKDLRHLAAEAGIEVPDGLRKPELVAHLEAALAGPVPGAPLVLDATAEPVPEVPEVLAVPEVPEVLAVPEVPEVRGQVVPLSSAPRIVAGGTPSPGIPQVPPPPGAAGDGRVRAGPVPGGTSGGVSASFPGIHNPLAALAHPNPGSARVVAGQVPQDQGNPLSQVQRWSQPGTAYPVARVIPGQAPPVQLPQGQVQANPLSARVQADGRPLPARGPVSPPVPRAVAPPGAAAPLVRDPSPGENVLAYTGAAGRDLAAAIDACKGAGNQDALRTLEDLADRFRATLAELGSSLSPRGG